MTAVQRLPIPLVSGGLNALRHLAIPRLSGGLTAVRRLPVFHLTGRLLLSGCLLSGCLLLGIPAAAQRPAPGELRALSDSLARWCRENRGDTLAQNLDSWWTDDAAGVVEVWLLRADSAMKERFRRRIHRSPRIRLGGFDPATTPFPPAPEGAAPPDGLTMRAAHAHYLPGTEQVRLTIRYRGREPLFFGTEYTLSRFRDGRWEVLPVRHAWEALLYAIGHPEPAPSGGPRPVPAEGYAHTFTAWLAPHIFPPECGRYRVSKRVWTEHPHREYLLTTEFTLLPWIGWTRFDDEPATP